VGGEGLSFLPKHNLAMQQIPKLRKGELIISLLLLSSKKKGEEEFKNLEGEKNKGGISFEE